MSIVFSEFVRAADSIKLTYFGLYELSWLLQKIQKCADGVMKLRFNLDYLNMAVDRTRPLLKMAGCHDHKYTQFRLLADFTYGFFKLERQNSTKLFTISYTRNGYIRRTFSEEVIDNIRTITVFRFMPVTTAVFIKISEFEEGSKIPPYEYHYHRHEPVREYEIHFNKIEQTDGFIRQLSSVIEIIPNKISD